MEWKTYEPYFGGVDIVHTNEENQTTAHIRIEPDGSLVATLYLEGEFDQTRFPAGTLLMYVKKWCKDKLYSQDKMTGGEAYIWQKEFTKKIRKEREGPGITDSQSEQTFYKVSFTADLSDYKVKINNLPVVFNPPYGYRIVNK